MHARTAPRTDAPRRAVDAADAHDPASAAADDDAQASLLPDGLRGLRALAVVAIVLSATGLGWMRGGAVIGVEVLFVLAGYLTVTLLRTAGDQTGLGDVAWVLGHLARRVVPALLTMLGGMSLLLLVTRLDALERLGADMRATVVALAGWRPPLPVADQAASPSYVEHLWVVVVGAHLVVGVAVAMLLVRSRRGRAVLRLAALVLAIAATVALAVTSLTANGSERALYATETRAAGLLVGAALGLMLRPAARGAVGGARGRRLQTVGLLALAGLLATTTISGGAMVWFARGGLLAVDVLAALVIAVIVRGAPLGRVLGAGGPRWLGLRSYGVYLWHWPVLLAFGGPVVVRRPTSMIAYVVVLLALADLTYRFVEVPLGGSRDVPTAGRVGRPLMAVRTTAIACGVASTAALLIGAPQA